MLNVLIVDDDESSMFLSESLLKRYFRTKGAKSGHEALEAVEAENFDVVLMDINLGDFNMDGIRTMRLMRNKRNLRGLRIIAVTSFARDRNFYISHGFDELFVKPLLEQPSVVRIVELCMKNMLSGNGSDDQNSPMSPVLTQPSLPLSSFIDVH